MKLPDWMRPIIGPVVGATVTAVASIFVAKMPVVGAFVNPETVAATATTWVMMNLFKTAVNSKVNPTNSATIELSKTVPTSVQPKEEKSISMPAATPGFSSGI